MARKRKKGLAFLPDSPKIDHPIFSFMSLFRIRNKVIFYHIHFYCSVSKERYSVCRLIRIHGDSHHLFSVIDKDFRTEAVQNQTKFESAVFGTDKASSLMDCSSSGTAEFSVKLQNGFMRPEADCCMIHIVLCKTDSKLLVYFFLIRRRKLQFQIHSSTV